jgi:hypothetical protein
MTTESQKKQILSDLLTGISLTGLDILKNYGCIKASNRISELKAEGYPIEVKMVEVKTKFGEKRVAQYRIENLKEAKKLSTKTVN